MARPRLLLVLACTFACAAGCGLTLSGSLSADPDASIPSPPSDDASPSAIDGATTTTEGGVDEDAGPPPPMCQTDACALPAGGMDFGIVLYGDRSAPCPVGFDSEDLIEGPTAGAGSCTCGTCVMTGTNCNQGNIGSKFGSTNACASNGANHQANNGNCRVQNGVFGDWASMQAPTAVPGTCSAPATAVKSAVTSTAVRTCKPQSATCAATLCTPPSSLKACSIHVGDIQCPPQAPKRHLVGTDVNPTCTSCGCTIAATCGGTFATYSNSDCTGTMRSLQSGVCTNMNGFSFNSTKWTGTIATQSCSMLPAPTATIALVGTKTVCCP